jgi:hypothetical protein
MMRRVSFPLPFLTPLSHSPFILTQTKSAFPPRDRVFDLPGGALRWSNRSHNTLLCDSALFPFPRCCALHTVPRHHKRGCWAGFLPSPSQGLPPLLGFPPPLTIPVAPSPPSQGLPLPSPLAVPPSLFIPLCPFVMPHTFPCDFLSTSSTFLLLLYFCTFSPRHQSVRSIPELKSNRSHFATQLLRSYPFALFEGICAPLRPLIPCCPTTTAPVALSRLSSPCPLLIFLFSHYCPRFLLTAHSPHSWQSSFWLLWPVLVVSGPMVGPRLLPPYSLVFPNFRCSILTG